MSAVDGTGETMHEHYIDEMVQRLKPVLKDPTKAKVILKRYWHERMALVWTIGDVYRAANERELALTKCEAISVLQTLHHQHNAQYGLKWGDVTASIEDQVLGRKLTLAEIKRFVERDHVTIQK